MNEGLPDDLRPQLLHLAKSTLIQPLNEKGRPFRTHMAVPRFRHVILLRESVSVAYVLLLAIDTELG